MLNLHLGYQTIFDEDVEDTCLLLDGGGTELERVWGNLKGNKGNLVLNQEQKRKEVQDGHPLRIKCTITT